MQTNQFLKSNQETSPLRTGIIKFSVIVEIKKKHHLAAARGLFVFLIILYL